MNKHKAVVRGFIDAAWNRRDFAGLELYFHEHYADHSLPEGFPAGSEGTLRWIEATSAAFRHQTVIEDMVCEGDRLMIRVRMELEHTGEWRGIPATGRQLSIGGYRCFRLEEGRIREAWGLMDGSRIENVLRSTPHGCGLLQQA